MTAYGGHQQPIPVPAPHPVPWSGAELIPTMNVVSPVHHFNRTQQLQFTPPPSSLIGRRCERSLNLEQTMGGYGGSCSTGVKRGYPYVNSYPVDEARYSSGYSSAPLSSIEELVSQQLQRNEMDGIDPRRMAMESPCVQNVGFLKLLIPTSMPV